MELNADPGERPFRFGVCMTAATSRKELVEKYRKAEEIGYDVIGVTDHLGKWAPFSALMLAVEVTEQPRIATAVLNTCFYHPALLARDIAGLDQLSEGRLELGLGTGYAKAEFAAAGMAMPAPRERVDHLEGTVTQLRSLLADPDHQPRLSQTPFPPLWLTGRGNRVLALAAREADIIGFTGFAPGDSSVMDNLETPDGIAERIGHLRRLLGTRIASVELNILVWRVIVTNERRATARRLGPARNLGVEQLLNVPTVFIGTAQQIAEQLIEYRERFGLSYITVGEYNLDALAPVIELLR